MYPDAFEYDWWTRFGMPVRALFDGRMKWDEAWLLFQALCKDPSSHVAAAVSGMDYPVSRELLAIADLFDLNVAVNTEMKDRHKNKPYPRPFRVETADTTKSQAPTVDQDVILEALRKRRPGGQ